MLRLRFTLQYFSNTHDNFMMHFNWNIKCFLFFIQMQTTYLLQGERMKLIYGSFAIPVASLSLFNSIVILVLVPVMDRFIYPLFEKLGMPLSKLQRIGECKISKEI